MSAREFLTRGGEPASKLGPVRVERSVTYFLMHLGSLTAPRDQWVRESNLRQNPAAHRARRVNILGVAA
jgi:hypothetical protein